MTRTLPFLTGVALTVVLPAWLLTVPVSAQQAASQERGEVRGGGGGGAPAAAPAAAPATSAPSGGSGSSGGSSSGGGSQSSGGGSRSGGGHNGGGGYRGGATGGSGEYAVPRAGGGERSGSGARAGGGSGATSGSGGSGTANTGGSSTPVRGTSGRQQPTGRGPRDAGTNGTGDGVPIYSRPRDGHTPVGTAVPRGSVPAAPTGGTGVFIPGAYYGGYGYYDPYGYGGYDGGGYGAGYGGYYGGYYDPWYGGYPTSPQSAYSSNDEGALRLKVRPREAEVFVDGYFVGVVDDFDGIFQRLHVDSGPHRIEVRAQGYEPLAFEVRITPDHTTTYQGEMKRIP